MTTPTGGASAAPLPHELTAEWTVRAHLTFARAGEPVHGEGSATEQPTVQPVHPVHVVYKWCTPCDEQDVDKTATTLGTSFRSTNSSATTTNADSAFGSPQASRALPAGAATTPGATAQVCGTRCRSTCNIMVSAVADFLPQEATTAAAANEPFVYHNKVRAQQLRDAFSQTSDHEESQQQSVEPQQQQRRRAAYEQRRATTEALVNFASRRQAEEANTYVPTYSPTPTTPSSTFKSASMPRIAPQAGGTLPRMPPNLGEKKPRTVHIDVYCTGSEGDEEADDEQQADVEISSSSSSSSDSDLAGSKRYDLDSNSTPQTVLDNEQMLLRHQRISGGAMPRRLGQPKEQKDNQPQQMSLGHAITKCSTAEEVTESKQLLFRKHIGDQRAAKLANLRQKYMRQPSDDTISSTYPNSSHSTMPRDATCSSISSVAAATDCVDSSWKETDEPDHPLGVAFGLAKSDSFDYENSLDRLRISQMERQWSRQHSLDLPQNGGNSWTHQQQQQPLHQPPQHLQTIKEVQSQRNSFQRSDTIPSESDGFSDTNIFNTYPGRQISQLQQRNRPGFLQFFGPSMGAPAVGQPTPPVTAPVQPTSVANADPFRLLHPSYRWKSEARDNLSLQRPSGSPSSERSSPQLLSAATTVVRCGSEAPPSTTSASTFGTTVVTPSPLPGRRFDISRDSPSVASEASTATVSGYTHEHLEKTRRFGNVVAMRKPGHHVGPTKNPNCQCESCQRWLAERFQLRGRAFSLGERPVLRRPQ